MHRRIVLSVAASGLLALSFAAYLRRGAPEGAYTLVPQRVVIGSDGSMSLVTREVGQTLKEVPIPQSVEVWTVSDDGHLEKGAWVPIDPYADRIYPQQIVYDDEGFELFWGMLTTTFEPLPGAAPLPYGARDQRRVFGPMSVPVRSRAEATRF